MDAQNVFLDACTALGENPTDSKYVNGSKDTIAYEKLKTIIKFKNGNWVADYNNPNQPKWEPLFRHTKSGLVFYSAYDWNAITCVGSRLCYCSDNVLEESVNTPEILALYNDFLN